MHCVSTRRQEQVIDDNVQGIYRLHSTQRETKRVQNIDLLLPRPSSSELIPNLEIFFECYPRILKQIS